MKDWNSTVERNPENRFASQIAQLSSLFRPSFGFLLRLYLKFRTTQS